MNEIIRQVKKLYQFSFLSILIAAASIGAQTAAETETAPQRLLEITVLEKSSGHPVPGAEVTIRAILEAGGDIRNKGLTDERGIFTLPIPDKDIQLLRLEAVRNGYAPVQLSLIASEINQKISTQQTLNLDKGTKIGGKVQDEQGNLIEGVTVSISLQSEDRAETAVISGHEEKTDVNGLWLCDIIPERPERIMIRFSDPNYRTENFRAQAPSPMVQLLREMKHVMIMHRQLNLTGQVLNREGEPIEGALVAQGADRRTLFYPSTKTDSEGRFTFQNVTLGEMILTIQAPGYSPDSIRFIIDRQMSPIVFRLEPGHTIKGRVVDPNGDPVPRATVGADTWHEFRSLTWETLTDANGCFVWNDAPPDEISINVNKRRYIIIRNYTIEPSEEEHVITLLPELVIYGRIIDADSNEPVNDFRFFPGVEGGAGQDIAWKPGLKITDSNEYVMRFTYPSDEYYIRVEAEGYETQVSRPVSGEEGNVALDFRLSRIIPVAGTVLSPDGSPIADVEVMVVTRQLSILNGKAGRRPSVDNLSVKTDTDGKFSFFPKANEYSLVILNDQGYAFITPDDLASMENIKLTAWSKLEGTLKIGVEPGVKENVIYTPQSMPLLSGVTFAYQTQTDENGKFVFDRIPAGEGSVTRSLRTKGNIQLNTHTVRIEARPGQTETVRVGGTGWPVTGKIIIPEQIKNRTNWQYVEGNLNINSPDNPYLLISFEINNDGSFRIEDVPAGEYLLYIQAFDQSSQPHLSNMEQVGSLTHSFNVPEPQGGRSDEALALGEFELEITTDTSEGRTLMGKTISDFKDITTEFSKEQAQGKSLLICFWDYEQRPSRNCVLELNKRAADLKQKGMETIAIQIANIDKKTIDNWLKEYEINLPTGSAGENESKIRYDWGVKALPWLILTNENHIVTAEGFSINELDEKLK